MCAMPPRPAAIWSCCRRCGAVRTATRRLRNTPSRRAARRGVCCATRRGRAVSGLSRAPCRSATGTQRAKHRKVHLFDIDVAGGQRFFESDTLSPGQQYTLVDTPFGKLGVAICFDVRFAELFRILALEGAQLIVVPAAFNMTTGPAHWELLFRARALDNQCFVAGCAPARDETAGYVSYAHSLVCDPWGRVQAQAEAEPELLICDIDLSETDAVRAQLPVLRARRTDLYQLKYEKDS